MTDKTTEPVSKSQRKRDSIACQKLGEALVGLTNQKLAALPLPEHLRDAILHARGIKSHGAHRRQIQYIGKLMRELDTQPIADALECLQRQGVQDAARHHQIERWRERLLEEGDGALGALLEQHPRADLQHLRQLLRSARKEQSAGGPQPAARRLFRYLRDLSEGGEGPGKDTPAGG